MFQCIYCKTVQTECKQYTVWPVPLNILSLSFQIPSTFNAAQAMAFDGCFHDDEVELTPFPKMTPTLTSDPLTTPTQNPDIRPMEGTRLRRRRSARQNVDLLVSNSYMIDSYSRLAFPLSYLLFNTIYWSLYSWSSSTTLCELWCT